ncbi:hypothetical protein R3P38DRAFT_3167434 [Favolaschia claudopus]|uniref:Uncharacterized protein n=1 Tax=Favolaschia claudopus TaxID=2862362 RepID=A0AAW0EDZ4_9AGAR
MAVATHRVELKRATCIIPLGALECVRYEIGLFWFLRLMFLSSVLALRPLTRVLSYRTCPVNCLFVLIAHSPSDCPASNHSAAYFNSGVTYPILFSRCTTTSFPQRLLSTTHPRRPRTPPAFVSTPRLSNSYNAFVHFSPSPALRSTFQQLQLNVFPRPQHLLAEYPPRVSNHRVKASKSKQAHQSASGPSRPRNTAAIYSFHRNAPQNSRTKDDMTTELS